MKLALSFTLALAAAVAIPKQAHACGGCFHQPNEVTQVAGHRMVLSVSQQQTTLWDQIQYAGNPSDFAWILPVHGTVTIGLSSDALFSLLDSSTDEQVIPPPSPCGQGSCGQFMSTGYSATASNGAGAGGGVSVVAQQTVGPYETVQLHTTDPNALANWLSSHGYVMPPEIKPITDAYVAEGFDFLAMKLVPGQGIQAMRPVRITTQGASLSLPLRMVAAGTGAMVPIKLWVIGEGRYEPSNMPSFKINPTDVVWDFASSSSNLSVLREQGFNSTNHQGWLIESATNAGSYFFQQLTDTAQYNPVGSGYGDDAQGTNAQMNAMADVSALTGTVAGSTAEFWITRLDAELTQAALANDLLLGASADQSLITPIIVPGSTKNPPVCPPPPQCGGGTMFGGPSSPSGMIGAGGSGGAGSGASPSGSAGCSVAGGTDVSAFAALAIAGAAVARRRRVRRKG